MVWRRRRWVNCGKYMKSLKYVKAGVWLCVMTAFSANVWSQNAKLLALWDFNDASDPTMAEDKLRGIAGTNVGGALYTADAGGRSGAAGDRAMDFQSSGPA